MKSTMKLRLLLFVILPVLLAGCGTYIPLVPGHLHGYIYVSDDALSVASLESLEFSSSSTAPSGYSPLSGAAVTLTGSGHSAFYATTGSNGFFEFTNVRPGSKVITVDHSSFRYPQTIYETVDSGVNKFVSGYKTELDPGIGYYLFIGIANYDDPYYDLDGADYDAERMYDALFDNSSLAALGMRLIDEQATKVNIRDAIDEATYLAEQRNNPDDYLVLYFAGRLVSDLNIEFILPYDGVDYGSNEVLISDGELRDWLDDFPGRNRTVILDTSYSQTFIDGNATYSSSSFGTQALRESGYTFIGSTRDDELATFDPDLGDFGNGVFTHYFARGIESKNADWNNDKKITDSEIFDYVRNQMQSYFGSSPDRHQPVIYSATSEDTVVFRYR